ncbi:hypothetical protein [Vibrio parahaemolyticus]|uniref:hypothetical protein n=1 Tax=Vibrio parahaemolyticus TaxID=670 RepID=UPI00226BB9C7|nr:hypothetical protein [Vibrio parahaemolyticus]MCX8858915.1 hypothetical protein [Vibrio parahaemolyticus]MCX8899781.1 hypothetical protein [Vibrio parahaemolyticus]MCX8919806.1 hypothetical protein [Vibrio parahaemolyticus]
MALGRGKRKRLEPKPEVPKSVVEALHIEQMNLKTDKSTIRFKVLKYKGVPKVIGNPHSPNYGEFREGQELIDMNREPLIRRLYHIFAESELNASIYSNFHFLCQYFQHLDNHDVEVSFQTDAVLHYFGVIEREISIGNLSQSTGSRQKSSMNWVLDKLDLSYVSAQIPEFKKSEADSYAAYTDAELTTIGKALVKGYKGYVSCYLAKEKPTICPFFDLEKLLAQGMSRSEISIVKKSAKQRVSMGRWENQLVRSSYAITAMLTGVNTEPLKGVEIDNLVFKPIGAGKYQIGSIKRRPYKKDQFNEIGQGSKRAKEFIEQWASISKSLGEGANKYLFPFINHDGSTRRYSQNERVIDSVSSVLSAYGIPRINNSRFRETKSAMMARILGDLIEVAHANNHSTNTVLKSYGEGVESVHQITLAGAFSAQYELSMGKNKNEVLSEIKIKYKDPMALKKYKALNGKEPNKTPTGVRCSDPFGENAQKSRKIISKIIRTDSKVPCISFLDCFECPNHTLIAEVEDIWKMLSFKDVVMSSLNRPSLNSKPSHNLAKVILQVEHILDLMENKSPRNYKEAQEKHSEAPHPFWDDEFALDDAIEVYVK